MSHCAVSVRDPSSKVRGVLILHILHSLFSFLHGDLATEDGSDCEVPPMKRIASSHHVTGVDDLLSKFGYCDCTVLLTETRRKGGEASQEEVPVKARAL